MLTFCILKFLLYNHRLGVCDVWKARLWHLPQSARTSLGMRKKEILFRIQILLVRIEKWYLGWKRLSVSGRSQVGVGQSFDLPTMVRERIAAPGANNRVSRIQKFFSFFHYLLSFAIQRRFLLLQSLQFKLDGSNDLRTRVLDLIGLFQATFALHAQTSRGLK